MTRKEAVEKMIVSGKKFWNGVLTVAAIFIVYGLVIYSFFPDNNYHWGLVGFYLAGAWAVRRLAKKFKPEQSPLGDIAWYTGIFSLVMLAALSFPKTLLEDAYYNWVDYNRTFFGAIRVFAPWIGITLGAVMLSATAKEKRKISRRVAVFVTFLLVGVSLLGNIKDDLDSLLAAKLHYNGQNAEKESIRLLTKLGSHVRVMKEDGIKAYAYNEKTHLFDPTADLEEGKLYPRYIKKRERKDGSYQMINIFLPDPNGEFTARAKEAWVRLEDVRVETKESQTVVVEKSGDLWKVHFLTDYPTEIYALQPDQKFFVTGGSCGPLWWQDVKIPLLYVQVPGTPLIYMGQLFKYKAGQTITMRVF